MRLFCCCRHRGEETVFAPVAPRFNQPAGSRALAFIRCAGEYDPDHLRFDHHQRSFVTKFGHGFETTRLSSAGLVYKHFGKEILAVRCPRVWGRQGCWGVVIAPGEPRDAR